jgi:hypothetical protein
MVQRKRVLNRLDTRPRAGQQSHPNRKSIDKGFDTRCDR